MTEIVKNNNSMPFDLFETGNGGANSSEAKGVFNTLFGGMELEGDAELKNTKTNPDEVSYAEMNMLAITNMLAESDLNLTDNIIEEINIRLKKLFEQINIDGFTTANINSKQMNGLGNENFVHIMKFLEELESLIKVEIDGKDGIPKLDEILNRIRIKLNDQVKATIEKKITSQDISKIDAKNVSQDHKSDLVKKEASLYNKDTSNLVGKSPSVPARQKLKSSNLDALNEKAVKVEISKTLSSKSEHLNNSQNFEKKSFLSMEFEKKSSETKMDTLSQNSTSTTLVKDLNSESNLFRQPLNFPNKFDNISNFETSNMHKSPQANQENNDRLFQTLNMLSKSWGNKLIEKIEKSIEDGIEQLEILLTPKSLGRLNVTINIHDTIAKINIIAESASAAALLGEAESKLSQMMEISGLKLASLQTQTNQFGGNHKGKEQAHKLASAVKKTNIEDRSKPIESIKNLNSENEGLNLIA